jgi:hypothetical protein
MRWLSVLALPIAACASAGGGSGGPPPADGPTGDPDGSTDTDGPPPDTAPPVDAPPQMVVLSQNINTVPNGTRLGCNQSPGNYTRENSYYRVFTLADHGITGTYQVQSVTFAVNLANAGGTQQPAQVKIGRYVGTPGGLTLTVADIQPINSANIQIPDGATSVTTPITGIVPPGANLIVELAIPDGVAAQNQFFIGTNAAGESKPGYIRAPVMGCDLPAPTSMNYVGQQNDPPIAKTDLILTVTGLKY